jgi:hypothetical protein
VDGLGDPLRAATGMVMRPATLRGYAEQAGFRAVEVLEMGHRALALLPAAPLTRSQVSWLTICLTWSIGIANPTPILPEPWARLAMAVSMPTT